MQFIRTTLSLCLMLFVVASVAVAQGGQQQMQQPPPAEPDSVSDTELQKFANVTDSAQTIQQNIRSEVQTMVEDQGMEFTRFQEIMQSRQNPQAGSPETTQEEQETIKKIEPQLMQLNKKAQQQFVQIIQDEGLSPTRFNQIMRGVQAHQELQKRLQAIQGDT